MQDKSIFLTNSHLYYFEIQSGAAINIAQLLDAGCVVHQDIDEMYVYATEKLNADFDDVDGTESLITHNDGVYQLSIHDQVCNIELKDGKSIEDYVANYAHCVVFESMKNKYFCIVN